MRPIPEPPEGSRPVLMHAGEGMRPGEGTVIFSGDDKQAPLTLICGNCSAPLAERVYSGQIGSVVLKCNGCGSFNEMIT